MLLFLGLARKKKKVLGLQSINHLLTAQKQLKSSKMSIHSLAHPVTSIRGSSDVHIHDAAFSNTMKRATMLIIEMKMASLYCMSIAHCVLHKRLQRITRFQSILCLFSPPYFYFLEPLNIRNKTNKEPKTHPKNDPK